MNIKEFFSSPRVEDIYNERLRLNKVDKTLCIQEPIEINYIDINKPFCNRRFKILYNDIKFECFFTPSNRKKLYVQLSAGTRDKKNSVKFERWSYFPYFDGIVINIDDPMYQKYPDIKVGWYYGNKKESYLEYIYNIIEKMKKIYDLKNENIYFIGSSAAGYASLYLAYRFEGATAMAFNPQLVLKNWTSSNSLEKELNISLLDEDQWNRSDITEIYKNTKSKFFIYSNGASERDWKDQLMPLCKKLCFIPDYGISRYKNFTFLISYINNLNPHGTQIPKQWMGFIEYTINEKNIDYLKSIYRIFCESLNELYNEKDKVINIKKLIFIGDAIKNKIDCIINYDKIDSNYIIINVKGNNFYIYNDIYMNNYKYKMAILLDENYIEKFNKMNKKYKKALNKKIKYEEFFNTVEEICSIIEEINILTNN